MKNLLIKILKSLLRKLANNDNNDNNDKPRIQILSAAAKVSDIMLSQSKQSHDLMGRYQKKLYNDIVFEAYRRNLIDISSYYDAKRGVYTLRAELLIAKKD